MPHVGARSTEKLPKASARRLRQPQSNCAWAVTTVARAAGAIGLIEGAGGPPSRRARQEPRKVENEREIHACFRARSHPRRNRPRASDPGERARLGAPLRVARSVSVPCTPPAAAVSDFARQEAFSLLVVPGGRRRDRV